MANTTPVANRNGLANAISGAGIVYETVVVTNDIATTAILQKSGYAMGVVHNNSGAALTITWYGSLTANGPFHAIHDQDGVAMTSVIAANDRLQECPYGIAPVPFVAPVGSVASATVGAAFSR